MKFTGKLDAAQLPSPPVAALKKIGCRPTRHHGCDIRQHAQYLLNELIKRKTVAIHGRSGPDRTGPTRWMMRIEKHQYRTMSARWPGGRHNRHKCEACGSVQWVPPPLRSTGPEWCQWPRLEENTPTPN